MRQLIFLGTGHGMPIASTSSSIMVEDADTNILLDVSGGHDIIGKFYQSKKPVESVQNIFISHCDSDHILGIVPIIRAIRHFPLKQRRRIFCSTEVKEAVENIFKFIAKNHYTEAMENIDFITINDRMEYSLDNWKLTFFDIQSNRSPQMGCTILFPDRLRLSFIGDEPLREHYLDLVRNSDVLIHEAFCLDGDQEIFHPHEKNHSTVKECAINAVKANAKKLVLFHMEDTTLKNRKIAYKKEVEAIFTGNIFVPVDLDNMQF